MGKLVTVKTGYVAVLLPNKSGDGSLRNYSPGDQVTVTDAEYAAFNAATLAAITLTTPGLPDPFRKPTSSAATLYQTAAFTTTAGGTIGLGTNFVTGPAGGVTYVPGFLTVPADAPSSSVVGPKSGSVSSVNLFHKQGAVVSVAPTSKLWFGGTYRTDTATTQTSTTVLDTAIQASDVGRAVSGSGIPAGATISAVSAGVSFTLSAAATTSVVGVQLALGPLTLWPAGTVPTFTASANALDFFHFETYDGGSTYVNTLTTKGLA
jgi:hypothetical protein